MMPQPSSGSASAGFRATRTPTAVCACSPTSGAAGGGGGGGGGGAAERSTAVMGEEVGMGFPEDLLPYLLPVADGDAEKMGSFAGCGGVGWPSSPLISTGFVARTSSYIPFLPLECTFMEPSGHVTVHEPPSSTTCELDRSQI